MRKESQSDLDLWLGDWSRGRANRPVVSYVQGPTGTDAQSIGPHRTLIERIAGKKTWFKLAAYARWRLGPGLPCFQHSDHVILGSQWSHHKMIEKFGYAAAHCLALPYPIDLQMFRPARDRRSSSDRLRVLWLGRFVPRKRLDLFLDDLAMAIKDGCDVEAWVVGRSGFVPNYETLLDEFDYPEQLKHWPSIPRSDVPAILADVDVMVQPSDNENFGSSVAEALACGVPAIVGATNGTGDYICDRSIWLADDRPEALAAAMVQMAKAKQNGELTDPTPSRQAAEHWFAPERVVDQLEAILQQCTTAHEQCQLLK